MYRFRPYMSCLADSIHQAVAPDHPELNVIGTLVNMTFAHIYECDGITVPEHEQCEAFQKLETSLAASAKPGSAGYTYAGNGATSSLSTSALATIATVLMASGFERLLRLR